MRRLMAVGAAAVVGAILFMGAPALAATPGYPPTTTTVPPVSSLTLTCPVGGSGTLTFTGFLPGSTVTITILGATASTVTVGPNGAFTVTVTCSDPHISINGGPLIAVPFGSNTVTASGTGTNGQPFSELATVIIPNTATTAAASSSSSSSGLAFTGADIGMMAGGGLLLLAAGTGLVLFTRRRAHTS
jgi:hypothetical protein